MSMKRTRRASSSANGSKEEAPLLLGGMSDAPVTWADNVADKADTQFKPYALSTTFLKGDLIAHPKFGRGIVTQVDGPRVEVLFQEGAIKLGHATASA